MQMLDSIQRSPSGAGRLEVPWAQVAIATAFLTIGLLVSLRFLSPEFDPSYRMISEYALGHYGWVLSLMFASWALSTFALAAAIQPRIRRRGAKIGFAFLVIAGVGEALASIFDIRHDFMHNLAGAMGMLGLPVAAMLITLSLGRLPRWARVKFWLLVLANLSWISVVLLVAALVLLTVTLLHVEGSLPAQAPETLPHGVIGLVGWANRFLVVVDCAWVLTVAAPATRLQHDVV